MSEYYIVWADSRWRGRNSSWSGCWRDTMDTLTRSSSFPPTRIANVSFPTAINRERETLNRQPPPADLVASAGNSTIILFHLYGDDLGPDPSPEPVDGLIGHHANVCALQYSRRHKKLISASWDCAARVWSRSKKPRGDDEGGKAKSKAGEWDCDHVLSGHEAAVWGVAILEGGSYDGYYLTSESCVGGEVLPRCTHSIEFFRLGGSNFEDVQFRGGGHPYIRRLSRCAPVSFRFPRLSSDRHRV